MQLYCVNKCDAPVQSGTVTYKPVVNSWIETAAAAGRLSIDGQGTIENDGGLKILYRHCSTALANLMPTNTITKYGNTICIFYDTFKNCERMVIYFPYEEDENHIDCIRFKGLYWIKLSQFYDIIYRDD